MEQREGIVTLKSLNEEKKALEVKQERLAARLTEAQSSLDDAQASLTEEQKQFQALEAQAKTHINAYIDAYMPQLASQKYAENDEKKGSQDEVYNHPIFTRQQQAQEDAEAADEKLVGNIVENIAGCDSHANVFQLFKQSFACGADESPFSEAVNQIAAFFFQHKALLGQQQEAGSGGSVVSWVSSALTRGAVSQTDIQQRLRHFVSYMKKGTADGVALSTYTFSTDTYLHPFAALKKARAEFTDAKSQAFSDLEDEVAEVQASRSRVSGAQDQVDRYQGQVDRYQGQVDRCQDQVDRCQDSIIRLQAGEDAKAAATPATVTPIENQGSNEQDFSDLGDEVAQMEESCTRVSGAQVSSSISSRSRSRSSSSSSSPANPDNENNTTLTQVKKVLGCSAAFIGGASVMATAALGIIAATTPGLSFGAVAASLGVATALPWLPWVLAGVAGATVLALVGYGAYRLCKSCTGGDDDSKTENAESEYCEYVAPSGQISISPSAR